MAGIGGMFAALALAYGLSAPPTRTGEVAQPSGKWSVNYAEAMCVASRDYGSGDARRTLSIRRLPLSGIAEIVLNAPGRAATVRTGVGRVETQPKAQGVDGAYRRWSIAGATARGERRVTMIAVEEDALARVLEGAEVLRLRAGADDIADAFAMPGMNAVLAAMARCDDELVARWQVDPAARAAIATPAQSIGTAVVPIDSDYPDAVFRNGIEGTAVVLYAVGADGRAHDCRTVATSGSTALDQASCRVIEARGRFRPARGADGKPVAATMTRKLTWRLPG